MLRNVCKAAACAPSLLLSAGLCLRGARRSLLCLLCAAVVLSGGACGRGGAAPGAGAGDAGSTASSSSSGKLAASLKDYIVNVNNRVQGEASISDSEKQILARSAKNGKVSAADYQSAWNDFSNCIVDRGYSTPVLHKFPNGMYQLAGENTTGGTQEQMGRLGSDVSDCMLKYVSDVDSVYQVQIGNPGLLSDSEEALVDCFHKTGMVPASYTKEQWLTEQAASQKASSPTSSYSVDMKDPQIRGCLATYGYGFLDGTDPIETVWYPFQK